MLTLSVKDREFWDESTEEFTFAKGGTLKLEHSLVSISKWEAKWHKSYFETESKTMEQMLSYIECMTINSDVPKSVYAALSPTDFKKIVDYIEDPMTATTIREDPKSKTKKSQFITSELIYYWMIQFGIPVEFEKWHINRLTTLIRVCSEENKPAKKVNPEDTARRYRELNKARKAKYHTRG